MQQLSALLALSPTECVDEEQLLRLRRESNDDESDQVVCRADPLSSSTASPSALSNHNCTVTGSTANSSFSIENILSSTHQHQQPRITTDHHHHHRQSADQSPATTYHIDSTSLAIQSLAVQPLSQAFYGRSLRQLNLKCL